METSFSEVQAQGRHVLCKNSKIYFKLHIANEVIMLGSHAANSF